METCPEDIGVKIKEEKFDSPPPLVIKPEPTSPEPCARVHPPISSNLPVPLHSAPELNPQVPSRPVGRFAPSKVARDVNKAVDLSTYQYGLYSFFAEGNENREYDSPHFDPHYGETDMKDPALRARAKKYFEDLRRERCEETEEYQIREQSSGRSREHRPMYQRKRKKVQKLVVLVPKIRISPTIQEYLRRRYPPNSSRTARLAARKKCLSSDESLQEEKLQEFMAQFESGAAYNKSRPYSVSQRVTRLTSRPSSSCSSQQSESTTIDKDSVWNSSRNTNQETRHFPSRETEQAPCNTLAVADRLIKSEPMDYESSMPNENPLMAVKREMLDCSHHNIQIKQEPIDYCEHDCPQNRPEIQYNYNFDQPLSAPTSLRDNQVPDSSERPPTLPFPTLPLNNENITPNIPLNVSQIPDIETESRKEKKKKHKRQCIPFPIKKEPLEEAALEATPPLIKDLPAKKPEEHPTPTSNNDHDQAANKKPKKHCLPFPIKQEPLEELSAENESLPAKAAESENLVSSESVKIKEEQLESDQMLMVEIFRKRVKKLKKIEVKPLVSVKEEPVDFGEVASEIPSPEIKEEPVEPTLMYIKPKPVEQKNAKKLKYVYGRRIQGRARMSASHPRGRSSLEVMEESEFDSAAKIDTPFSPPKSAWSKITPTVSASPESDEETEENKGLTAQIDRLIEAGNIQTLDDTEIMYSLFASTIKDIQDPKANVFNIVLERFKETKAFEKSMRSAEENHPDKSGTDNPAEETPNTPALVTLFPMSDQEIYSQGLAVVGETKPPEEFELPSIKEETLEEDDIQKLEEENVIDGDRADTNNSNDLPEPEISDSSNQPVEIKTGLSDLSPDKNFDAASSIEPSLIRDLPVNDNFPPPYADFSRISPIRIRNSLERLNKPNILKTSTSSVPSFHPDIPTTSTSGFDDRPPLYIDSFQKTRRESDEKIRVVDESSEDFRESGTEHGDFKSDERPPTSASRQKGDMSEAERLFDEMLADEQTSFPSQEPAYMEPFPRSDTLFANTSLDDFIKAPLSANEHLVKPKPSYVRMNYHDSSESVENFKPPGVVLFSSKPEDLAPKENPDWSQWRRQHESFDQFQSSSWAIDEQSNSWSPQHSLYDNYLEPPTSSASFEDHQKDPSRLNCFETNSLSSWIEGRRLSNQGTFPIIERNDSGQEVVKIPVELREVQTQFPNHSKHCASIDVSTPVTKFIEQRQVNVADVGVQTNILPPYSPSLDYGHHTPLSSVLVEPLLSARKVSRPSPRTPSSEDTSRLAPTVQQRTCQTQYPANNSIYSPFEPSVPFKGYHVPNRYPTDSCTQTEGAPLFPPWVAPGRFRRHRPVLVEPLPNIEPIGENVRTMRSSDAYSILMEQIRTSNDPSFDKFMNSQQQPNGVVSKFNKYACYAPQGNSPELPLTVKKNYPKKSGNVCKGKRPGIEYKEVSPQQVPSEHSNRGLTPYQISVKIRRMGQVENIIGRLSTPKKRKSLSPKR
ncbi:hypothetical protein ACHWQZ_G009146 [Mnemiopsis leidyi]